MTTSTNGRCAADLPPQDLATCERLAEQHARLRHRGVHHRDGEWIVANAADVTTALASPVMSVRASVAVTGRHSGPARLLQAEMARFSDAPQHARRRAVLEQLLPCAAGLDAAAARATASWVKDQTGVWDVMPLARTVPVLVLAGAVDIPAAQVYRVAELTGRLCDALAPLLPGSAPEPNGDDAAQELMALLEPVGPWNHEQITAVLGLLFQARDATAALIGAALLDQGPADDRDPATCVNRALRQDAPVQCTRRSPVNDVQLGGVTVPRGALVWVVLAAAEQGAPSAPTTFGAGPHACPGAAHAVTLACGVLAALSTAGWRPVPGQDVRYEPRPNLRVPTAVLVQQS